MNDTPFSIIGDEPVEARIVAWVLGEASAFEAGELERLCAERPELLVFKRRMRALHGLLTEAEAAQPDEGWRLPAEKRKALDGVSGESARLPDPAVEKRIRYSARRALLAIAACLILTVIIAGLTAPAVIKQRKMAFRDTSARGMIVDQKARTPMVELKTGYPAEMIEGTPKPINVPNLEAPVNGPAGAASWATGGKELAERESLRHAESASRPAPATPAAPAPAPSKPASAVEPAAIPQLASSNPRQESPKMKAPVGSGRIVKSEGEDEAEVPSLAERESLTKAGAGTVNFSGGNTYSGGKVVSGGALGIGGQAPEAPKGSDLKPSDPGTRWEVRDDNQKAFLSNLAPGEGQTDTATLSGDARPRVAPPARRVFSERAASDIGLDQPADSFADISGDSSVSGTTRPGAMAGFGGAAAASPDAGLVPHPAGKSAAQPARQLRAKEDVSKVDGIVPTLEELPEIGSLFKGRKENAAPVSGNRSGDQPVGRNSIDAILNNANRSDTGGFDGSVSYGSAIAGEKGLKRIPAEKEAPDLKSPDDPVRSNPARTYEANEKTNDVRRNLYMAEGNMNLGKLDEAKKKYEQTLRIDPANEAAQAGMKKLAEAKSDYYRAAYDHTRAEMLMDADKESQSQIEAKSGFKFPTEYEPAPGATELGDNGSVVNDPRTASLRKDIREQEKKVEEHRKSFAAKDSARRSLLENVSGLGDLSDHNGIREKAAKLGVDYDSHQNAMIDLEREEEQLKLMKEMLARKAAHEQPETPKPDLAKLMEEISASDDPYSTFSLNISDASFKIAQAALARGERPDPAGVKVEQFYNAVDYGDPAPTDSSPVALASERCAHPVIPGRELVRISVKTAAAGRSAAQPLRLTLLVDQSGSMVRADRREAMAKALSSLAGLLTANDRVTLIGFSRTPHLLADGMSGDQAAKLPGMVHQESAEGGTNLEEAIKLAGQLAARHKQQGAQNRIVLFTDGAANLGDADPAGLAERVKALRQGGFAFDIAGIAADDLNDELLGELARNGNGRYYIVGKGDDHQFAERLAGAFRPAAENVKVQVRFNPERVARYKLIGFEKDRLKTEDFRNDAVDAAEMAAEEAGVAVYQVETIPGGSGELGEVSVRFRDAASDTMVERSLVLPHSGPAQAFDKASPPMQLAVLSMLAAEKLKGGPLGAAVDFSRLNGPRGNVRAFFGPASRAAEMLQVIDQIK